VLVDVVVAEKGSQLWALLFELARRFLGRLSSQYRSTSITELIRTVPIDVTSPAGMNGNDFFLIDGLDTFFAN
jgi:hypothetical protein